MELSALISERFPSLVCEENFSFAKHTTIGCGGTAALAVFPADTRETAEVVGFFTESRIPYCCLGAGANVLPEEGYFQGVVVRFSRLKTLRTDKNILYAGAGVTGGELLRFAAKKRLGGFEAFAGIPTTVGGGVAMNAGVAERHFGDLTERVVCVRGGEVLHLSHEQCAFSQKSSIFLNGLVVTGVYFRGEPSSGEEIASKTADFRARRAHLPDGRSMGCTFVNPQNVSAGRLIEECGLKGFAVGGAVVSPEHANFIINRGGTSQDVAELIDYVKERVFQRTGILLREEIRRIP